MSNAVITVRLALVWCLGLCVANVTKGIAASIVLILIRVLRIVRVKRLIHHVELWLLDMRAPKDHISTCSELRLNVVL